MVSCGRRRRDCAAPDAEISPGLLIEARPVGDDFLKDTVVLVSIRAYVAGEELDLPDAAIFPSGPGPPEPDGVPPAEPNFYVLRPAEGARQLIFPSSQPGGLA